MRVIPHLIHSFKDWVILIPGEFQSTVNYKSALAASTSACVCLYVLVTQSHLRLCDPTDCNPPGSSVRGILQARKLEWVAIPISTRSSHPRDQTLVFCIAAGFFTIWTTREVCQLPLQGLTVLLHLLIFNTFWKEFRVESRNEVLCDQRKTGKTGLQIVWYFQELIL